MLAEIARFRHLGKGDFIKIRECFVPPCPSGKLPVHSEFLSYMEDHGNRFTIRRIYAGGTFVLVAVFEAWPLLETFQIEKILSGRKGMLVLNCHGKALFK